MYIQHKVNLSDHQKKSLADAMSNKAGIKFRLSSQDLVGDYTLHLTPTQIKQIEKKRKTNSGLDLTLSKPQVDYLRKNGGFLPLLPLIIGAITAAGTVAGGASGIAKAVDANAAAKAKQRERERHNRELEKQLKGSGLYLRQGKGLFLGKKR